ncbi:unnamed protein product [Rhodiola kirilowii]
MYVQKIVDCHRPRAKSVSLTVKAQGFLISPVSQHSRAIHQEREWFRPTERAKYSSRLS